MDLDNIKVDSLVAEQRTATLSRGVAGSNDELIEKGIKSHDICFNKGGVVEHFLEEFNLDRKPIRSFSKIGIPYHLLMIFKEWLINDGRILKEFEHHRKMKEGKGYGCVYIIIDESGRRKIGITNKEVTNRLNALQTSNAEVLKVEQELWGYGYETLEKKLHVYFNDKRILGEWFNLEQEDVLDIMKTCENNGYYLRMVNTFSLLEDLFNERDKEIKNSKLQYDGTRYN